MLPFQVLPQGTLTPSDHAHVGRTPCGEQDADKRGAFFERLRAAPVTFTLTLRRPGPWGGSTLFLGFEDHAMIDITTLSREEQLQLLEKLWDSLSSTPEAVPLTDAQREELDRRLDELDREGPVGIPAEEVLGRQHTRRA